MAERIAYVEAVFGADITAFRRGTSQVRRDLNLLSDTAGGLSRIGRTMTLMLTAPLVAMGGAAVKASGDFEAAMRNVNSILFATEDELQALSEATLRFGSELRSGPTAAAEALYTVVSAGFTDMATALEISQVAARTAEAGLADLAVTSEALAAAMLAYGAGSDEAAHYSDVLTRSVQVGVGEMQEFANSMGLMVSSGAGLGITYDELGAGQAFLTQRGLSASRAATSLNMALVALMKPTDKMKAVFQELGVATGQQLIDQFGGLEGAMRALSTVFDGDAARITDVFGREQGARAARSMILDIEGYSRAMEEFREAVGGATDRALAEQYKSFPAALERLTSAAASAGIAIGDKLVPFLRPGVEALRQFLLSVQDIPDELLLMGIAFTTALAAAGPMLWLLGSMLTPIGLVSVGFAGLATAVALNLGGARDAVTQFVNDVTGGLGGLVTAVRTFWDEFTQKPPTMPDLGEAGTGAARGVSFTISEEMGTLWDVFQQNGADWGYTTYDAFYGALTESMGEIDPYTLQLGDVFTIAGAGGGGAQRGEIMAEEQFIRDSADDFSFGGRIKAGIEASWPLIETALNTIKTNIGNWFTGTFIPSFDSFGTGVLQGLTNLFTAPEGSDETSLVGTVKTFIEDNILGGIEGGISAVTTALPGISASVVTLFQTVGNWLVDTGIPTLAYSIGYLGGTISSLIVQALSGIGGSGEFNGPDVGAMILTPLSEGFQTAKGDMGLADSLAPELASAIMLAIPLLASQLGTLGFATGVSNVVWSVLSTGFTTGGALASGLATRVASSVAGNLIGGAFLANFRTAFGTLLGGLNLGSLVQSSIATSVISSLTNAGWAATGLAAKVAAGLGSFLGVALPVVGIATVAIGVGHWMLTSETGQAIQNFMKTEIVDRLFGEGFYAEINRGFENWVNNTLANLFTLAGNEEAASHFLPEDSEPIVVPMEAHIIPNPEAYDPAGVDYWAALYATEEQAATGMAPLNTAIDGVTTSVLGATTAVNTDLTAAVTTAGTTLPGLISPITGGMSRLSGEALYAAQRTQAMTSALEAINGRTFRATLELNVTGGPLPNMSGFKAMGGSVLPGKSYVVGEQGPELLTMGSTSGFVSSNGSLAGAVARGGSSSVSNNHVVINGVQDVDGLLYELERRGIYL